MICDFDIKFMQEAVEQSKKCPYSMKAYSVGAVVVDKDNNIISTGYSRETADNVHAEETAINKAVMTGIVLKDATIYSTMEPCGLRLSGNKCCADRIIEAGFKRVVFGINEPPFFVANCTGAQKMMENGIIVEQMADFNEEIEKINSHIK